MLKFNKDRVVCLEDTEEEEKELSAPNKKFITRSKPDESSQVSESMHESDDSSSEADPEAQENS